VDVLLEPPARGGCGAPLADLLVRAAAALDAALLVVAAHGRGGPLAALLAPSAAAEAALTAATPVIVLHSPAAAARPLAPPSRVLLAVDDVDDATVAAAAWTLDTLLWRGAASDTPAASPPALQLHALHVLPRPPPPDLAGLDAATADAWRAGDDDPAVAATLDAAVAALDARLGPLAAAAGVDFVPSAVADVSVGDAVADAAEAVGADAVVVVHRAGRGGLEVALRGSVAAHVVRAVEVPVAVLHK
jgi:nucleotide-binding universal stress UspA family protein